MQPWGDRLKGKQDSFVLQLLKARSNEPEELRWPLAGTLILLQWLENLQLRHFAPKIPLIEILLENRFVGFLQLAESELLRQQLEPDRGVFQLVTKPLQRIGKNVRMVKSEARQFLNGPPPSLGGIRASPEMAVGEAQGKIRDRDDAPARVALRLAEGIELLQIDFRDSGFLLQLAESCLVKILVVVNEAPGNRI